MSYAQRTDLSGNRTLAWIFTIAVVGTLLYAIVTGLAFNVIKKAATNLKVIDIEQQPPPPEPPPPPPKDMPKVPPPPMTPPPLVRTQSPPPPIQTVTAIPPPAMPPPVMSPPMPPPPPPPPRRATSPEPARGDVRSAFSTDDYPPDAEAAGAQGTAQAQLTISPDGRVSSCNLVRSTGNSSLDRATCSVLRRVKFTPSKDANGNATVGSYSTPPITWQLPKD
jgi:protein TonB